LLSMTVMLSFAVACGRNAPDAAAPAETADGSEHSAGRLSIYTVNYPLAYFAERIGGELVEVTFPAPADIDPAYWNPGPEEIAAYQQADLILLNGATYAKWVERASLPASRTVDTGAGFADRWIELEEGTVHSHGLEGEHSHTGWAFTTWLDPGLAMTQAEAVAEAIERQRPASTAEIQSSLAALQADWQELDRSLAAAAEQIAGRPLLFSHPVYQYFERRYGLDSRSLHWEPDEMPAESQWQELESWLVERPVEWMIWESRPLAEIEQRLAELGIQTAVFDPCGNVPESGDLLAVMRRNVEEMERIAASE
jgi:zinc transport system substrate-binding protein